MEQKVIQVIERIIKKIERETQTKINSWLNDVDGQFEMDLPSVKKMKVINIKYENKIFYVYNTQKILRLPIACVTIKMLYQTILNAVFLLDKNTIEKKLQWDKVEKHRKQTIELDKKKYLQEVENSRDGVLQILKKYAEFVRAIGKEKDFQQFANNQTIYDNIMGTWKA